MSWKDEFIERYGEVAYEKKLERSNEWNRMNPEKMERRAHNQNRKGGKYYEKTLGHNRTGLRNERNKIRMKHRNNWREYKKRIAPGSQIHHEWLFETADFRGVALVEADQHRQGNINVIQILDGEITLFTEKEISEQNMQ